jgi:DNA polymerase-3 subunit gamma/tau
MYQVLARKWRPQTFEQLIGQPHVSRTLRNAVESDRLAHAYIFAGLRGTGKTTVARILAKCLNCEQGPTTTPCGTCAPCVEIAESRAIDVLEIDAASRTKVEQTRELLEIVSYAPARDRYKVLIIDEAHMLSKASFNALLKTLEEPPPNVVFVLATTELQKILPTIHSRCQVFDFRRVSPAEMAAHLRMICDDEKIDIPDAALERLARSGEGSVRDSLSLLERAVAFCGTAIEDEDVLRMLGAVHARVLSEMVTALARRDAAAMLTVLDGLLDEGHDLVHFWNALIAAVRDLLLQRSLPDRKELLSRPPAEAEALVRAAEDLSREDLTRVFQVLADLEPGLKASSQPRFLFEAALIRLASLGAVRPIEEVLQSLGEPAPAVRRDPARKGRAQSKGRSGAKREDRP